MSFPTYFYDLLEELPTGAAQAPIIPVDLSVRQSPIKGNQTDQLHTNISLFTNPIPFGPYDYSNRVITVRSSPPDQIHLNINLFTNPIPFGPFDYSKPFYPRVTAPQTVQTALSLFANLGPFTQTDFGKARQALASATQPNVYNQNLYTVVVTAPFAQVNWLKPFFPAPANPLAQPFNINLFSGGVVVAPEIHALPFFASFGRMTAR